MSGELIRRTAEGTFNGLFLGELIAFGIVTVLFLFYFNRVFGLIVAAIINSYTWPFYRVTIHLQSLQISPLGGRIFIKGFQYHGQNEAIFVHDGYITWRYWLRRVANAEVAAKSGAESHHVASSGSAEKQGVGGSEPASFEQRRPCRISINLRGLEWFIYNRKPAYDIILATIVDKTQMPASGSATGGRTANDVFGPGRIDQSMSPTAADKPSQHNDENVDPNVLTSSASASSVGGSQGTHLSRPELPIFLKLLPIGISCSRAAMVMGNEHTRSVLVAKFAGVDGRVDAQKSGSLDLYKQCFEFGATHASAAFKYNQGFGEDQLTAGARLRRERQEVVIPGNETSWLGAIRANYNHALVALRRIRIPLRPSSASIVSEETSPRQKHPPQRDISRAQGPWTGLSRYLVDDVDMELAQKQWSTVEYARSETIADIPKLQLKFFWDVPGIVADTSSGMNEKSQAHLDRVTGAPAPQYGLDINLGGGTVNYGPWADRQRADIQSVFFPASFAKATTQTPLPPGASRISTEFKIRIVLDEEVVLRLHTREPSKDARWMGSLEKSVTSATLEQSRTNGRAKKGAKAALNPEVRPAGWIEAALSRNSSVNYNMDMVAGLNGYQNIVHADVRSVRVTSSVNHDVFLHTSKFTVNCDLPNPLAWNADHVWDFAIESPDLSIFMLRDHAFLIEDLVNDWTSAPSGDFFEFVPYMYNLKLCLPNFKLYLNVNDANIINNATSIDDNAFLIIGTSSLDATVKIPALGFQPTQNKVTFDTTATDLRLDLSTPIWTTQRTFLNDKQVASLEQLTLHGSYNYYSATSSTLTDTLLLDISGSLLYAALHGFLVRYFMNFKDNYFDADLHFQTQEEFQRKLDTRPKEHSHIDKESLERHPSNDLDVILRVKALDPTILLPSQLYTANEYVKAEAAEAVLDLRFTNYYMDMQVDFSPLSLGHRKADVQINNAEHEAEVFIDGATVTGHRLFGLPPSEPTYVCNWDFAVGRTVGEGNASLLSSVIGAVQSFAFGFVDSENALRRPRATVLHDIIFLRAIVQPIKLWVHVGDAAFLLSTGPVSISLNDWAGQRHSEHLQVKIPHFTVACIDARNASRSHIKSKHAAPTYAYLTASLHFRVLEAKPDFEEDRNLQQRHVALHDVRTHRTPWLLRSKQTAKGQSPPPPPPLDPPAMPFPPMPDPLVSSSTGTSDDLSFRAQSLQAQNAMDEDLSASQAHVFSKGDFDPLRLQMRGLGIVAEVDNQSAVSANVSAPERYIPESSISQPSTTIGISSAFHVPYYPLLAVTPDTKDVPTVDTEVEPEDTSMNVETEHDLTSTDGQDGRISLFLDCQEGLRVLVTPEAISKTILLISSLAPGDPSGVIDTIQADSIKEEGAVHDAGNSRKVQIYVRLPAAKLRFLDHLSGDIESSAYARSYELSLSRLSITAQDLLEAPLPTRKRTIHVQLNKLDCVAATENKHLSRSASVILCVQRILFWAVVDTVAHGHVQAEDVTITCPERDTLGLGSLISETVRLTERIAKRISSTTEQRRLHVASLMRALTACSRGVPEAPFTTSTSFVLRTASHHPRNTDTWKLVCRLRWIWQCLTDSEQEDVQSSCDIKNLGDIENARLDVFSVFEQWRGWDFHDIHRSNFMKNIFGDAHSSHADASPLPALALDLSANLNHFSAALHPDSSKNHITLEALRVGLIRSSHVAKEIPDQTIPEEWTVQLYVGDSNSSIDWSILEILNGIQEDVDNQVFQFDKNVHEENPVDSKTSVSRELHVVAGADSFRASVETLNIEAVCSISRFASSSCLSLMSDGSIDALTILHAANVESRIRSKSISVLQCSLNSPTLHSSLAKSEKTAAPNMIWKCGALCRSIELNLEQDVLSLIGVMDRVCSEELHHVQQMYLSLHQEPTGKAVKTPITSQKPKVQVHIGLLLESYTLSATLLSSLRYIVRGDSARSTGFYTAQLTPTMTAEFDIGPQSHIFVNVEKDLTHEIAQLILPPFNGHVMGSQSANLVHLRILLALEQIVLDASALHALFSTYSRKELLSFREDVSRDMRVLKGNIKSLSSDNEAGSRKQEVQDRKGYLFMYKAAFSAAGLKVKARTGQSSSYAARLTFNLGCVCFRLNNEDTNGHVLPLPEMAAKFQVVKVKLKRSGEQQRYRCGDFSIAASFIGTSKLNEQQVSIRSYEIVTTDLDINLHPETASTIVDIIGYLQQRFKSFNLSSELSTLTVRARRMRSKSRTLAFLGGSEKVVEPEQSESTKLFSSMYSLEMRYIQVAWHVGESMSISPSSRVEDLVFSLTKVNLATQKTNSARLIFENLQLQMAPRTQPKRSRSKNSALLPEVAFNVAYLSTDHDRRLAFQAVGKALDLRLTSQSIVSAANLTKSIGLATRDLRKVIADWNTSFIREEQHNKNLLGNKTLSSVLIAADFAGAVVHIHGRDGHQDDITHSSGLQRTLGSNLLGAAVPAQVVELQAPGIALKLEYKNTQLDDPSLSVETRIDASSNVLHPASVLLFLQMSESLKEVVGDDDQNGEGSKNASKPNEGDVLANADPAAILGRTRLNLGLRISKQQFGFTCQPIARVAANAQFEDIYITISTVQAPDQTRFFALSSSVVALQCSLQHVYSREATGHFTIERINVSLINSKHVSNKTGLSAIVQVGPMSLHINAKQMQDFFLFREIWIPNDITGSSTMSPVKKDEREGTFDVQRYQQMAATGAFPWNASITISKLEISVDLGQALGKTAFSISDLWVSSKKSSDWKQNLCMGFEKVSIGGSGRMSGAIELQRFRLQTSIDWPEVMRSTDHTPLIEASTSFEGLHAKLAFDYQAVMMAEFSALDLLMYNVRDSTHASGDRLVCFVNGNKIHAFCTTQSSAQSLALYQAITRLIQEKRAAYESSLKDVDKFMRRRTSSSQTNLVTMSSLTSPEKSNQMDLIPRQLQTNVVISLNAVKVGAYPRTFFDQQIFKVEALDASARFSVKTESGKVRSGLGMSLGQVRVALSSLTRRVERKAFEDMVVADVVEYSTGSRGGTILKVPRLVAEMRTWQMPSSFQIDYVFRSAFEGKVEVGWNYSRISYIRGMWGSHARSLAQRLGRPLPQSVVRISGGLPPDSSEHGDTLPKDQSPGRAATLQAAANDADKEKEQNPAKITAVVDVPLSRYDYTPLEPPIIVTPQLRDMGEATPPLEWIGLQRERLPNLTHQVVIVPLLEVAKEVEDAYVRILGGS